MYLAALPGGWITDNYLGQKRAILPGALTIAFGHLCIAFSYFNNKIIFVGMVFLVIGTGLFKTCASVMVGMLYKKMMQGVILVLLFFICVLILVLLFNLRLFTKRIRMAFWFWCRWD